MSNISHIPTSIIEATKAAPKDDMLIEIDNMTKYLEETERELRHKKADLEELKRKRREEIKLAYRESTMWCVKIDQNNPWYFLKTSMGIAHCIAYKNSVDLDKEIKSKSATALSWLFLNKQIGRVAYNGTNWYGVLDHFVQDEKGLYTIINPKLKFKMDELREVTIKRKA